MEAASWDRAAAYLRVTPRQGQGHDELLKKKIQGQIERRTTRRQGAAAAAETMQRWRAPRWGRGGSAGGREGGERSYGQGLYLCQPNANKEQPLRRTRFVELSFFCELNALSWSKSTQQ